MDEAVGQSNQVYSLRDLLTSTLVATVDADTATALRYFNNMCEIAFEKYNPQTNEAEGLRTLTFQYSSSDGIRTLSQSMLSLVPIPLLQIQEADFSFDVQILGMKETQDEEILSLTDNVENSELEESAQLMIALQPISANDGNAMTTVEKISPNMKVNIHLCQADMPGGLSRMLQIVNNID